MENITVRQIIALTGGNTKVIIEDYEYENKIFWQGTVDDWFRSESEEKKLLGTKNVQTMTVINETDVLRLMIWYK